MRIIIVVFIAAALLIPVAALAKEKDCFTVSNSEWKACGPDDKKQGLVLMLKNICPQTMQLHACIKKEDGEWDCKWFRNVKKADEVEFGSCDNTGDYKLNACKKLKDCETRPE